MKTTMYDDSYEIATGVEIDTLLSELPLELMKENLNWQIKNPLQTDSNYLNVVSEKYEILKDNFSEDDLSMAKLKLSMDDVFEYTLSQMNDRFDLGIDMNNLTEDIITLTDNIYTYFILNFKRNIHKFFYRFIKENKKMLSEYYDKFGKKKDVTTLNLKKQIKNKDDILILSYLPSIMNYIKNLDIESLDFIEYTLDDDNYEASFVRNLVMNNTITGDFVDKYLTIIFDENDTVLDEIQIGIKMKLIQKFM